LTSQSMGFSLDYLCIIAHETPVSKASRQFLDCPINPNKGILLIF
jgi:hypothetical protein